jgi:hypothetical protein
LNGAGATNVISSRYGSLEGKHFKNVIIYVVIETLQRAQWQIL